MVWKYYEFEMLAVNRGVQETSKHYCLCYPTESQKDLYAEVFRLPSKRVLLAQRPYYNSPSSVLFHAYKIFTSSPCTLTSIPTVNKGALRKWTKCMALLSHEFQQQINENMETIKQKILTTKFSHHWLQVGEVAGRSYHFCCN